MRDTDGGKNSVKRGGSLFFRRFGLWVVVFFWILIASSCSFSSMRGQNTSSSYCTLLDVAAGTPGPAKPKPFLGVIFGPKDIGRKASLCKKKSTFIEIMDVVSCSPAAKAGIKEGDVILAVDGTALCKGKGNVGDKFKDMIAEEPIGSVVDIEVLRSGRRFTLSARLRETPLHEQPEALPPESVRCTAGRESALGKALKQGGSLQDFKKILSGLDRASNEVHNTSWFLKGPYNPFQLKEFTYLIRHPLRDGEAARKLTDSIIGAAHGNDFRLDLVARRAAFLLDDGLTAERKTDITFPGLIRAMETVKKRLGRCLGRLSPEERKLVREKALSPWDDSRWNDIVKTSAGMDFRELSESFSPLLPFFSRKSLQLLREDVLRRFGNRRTPVLYEADTSMGRVIVGGDGPNVYKKDAALILDLGGDDVYLNNAGGTRPGIPVAIVIDWGGDDVYLSKHDFSQGAGLLGGGFLFDLSGNDVFDSLDGSQGAGFFGMGILYHGRGRAVFKGRRYCQGVGEMGMGIIWNGDGNTRYLCSEYGQGMGLFKGLGMLTDEKGDDYYQLGGLAPDFRDPGRSTVSMGQGFGWGIRPEGKGYGVSGGIGILIDEQGNDTYDADYFAQGASYYYGTGILSDLSGNDRYIAGRYAQGAGIHSSVGILSDRSGNDFYYSSFGVSQGMGHDYGVGFLGDERGNDRYMGGILSQGAATRGGVGILVDSRGDDRFTCSAECQAFAEDERCIGILADGEPGHDRMSRYGKPERINPERIRFGLKTPSSEDRQKDD